MPLERLVTLEGVEVMLVEEVDPQSRGRQRGHDLSGRVLELDVPAAPQFPASHISCQDPVITTAGLGG